MARKKVEIPERKPSRSGRTRTLEERAAKGQVRILLSLDKQWMAKLALIQEKSETNQDTLRRLILDRFDLEIRSGKKST